MHLWSEIRRRVLCEELSLRQACREYHLNFRTIVKIVNQSQPSPYQQLKSRAKPVLGPFLDTIQQILTDDRSAPTKQRHTARRIFERLRDQHGYTGCMSIVRDAVAACRHAQAEVFVPLLHRPGEAQCDYGSATVVVAGQRCQAAFFVLTLPHCGARFAAAYPRECTETFHQGHVAAFTFFGGVPNRISYDNSKIAVAKHTGPHQREVTAEFCRLQSHFLFAAHFCRVRQAHEKGHVENGVGYVRRNFLVPVPDAPSWQELNARLADDCVRDRQRCLAGRSEPIEALLPADRAAFLPLPAEPFEAHRLEVVAISSLSLGRFDRNDYSVPTRCTATRRLLPQAASTACVSSSGARWRPSTAAAGARGRLCSIRCIIWPCSNASRGPSTTPGPWPAGSCPIALLSCVGVWKRPARKEASGSLSACCVCWRTTTRPC